MTATKLRRATYVFALSVYLGMGSAFTATKSGSTTKAVAPDASPKTEVKAKGEAKAAKKKPTPPTEITASETSYDFNKGLALFVGNVHVVDATMDIRADEMQIYRNKKTGKFMKIIALGKKNKVVFTTPEGKAEGKQATYDLATGTMVMTGQLLLDTPGMRFVDPSVIKYQIDMTKPKDGGQRGGKFIARNGRIIITNTDGQSFKSLLSIDETSKEKKNSTNDKNTAKNDVPPKKKP